MATHRKLLLALILIFFSGVNLRPAIISVSPLIRHIQESMGLSAGTAGTLMGLPVLLLGLSAPFAPVLLRWLPTYRVISMAMLLMAFGIFIRSISVVALPLNWLLWVGTLSTGVGIGLANTLVPGIIKDLPERIRNLTTAALSFGICLGGAIAAIASPPLRIVFWNQWALALALWAVPALICAFAWWFMQPADKPDASTNKNIKIGIDGSLWRNAIAIALCAHMSMQSLLSHSVSSWLPTILIERGLSDASSGAVLSTVMLAQLVTSFAGVMLASITNDQRVPVIFMYLLALAGFGGVFYLDHNWSYLYAILLGLGQGGTFSIGLLMIIKRVETPYAAVQLMALTQFVGYMVASAGPSLLGFIHDYYASWNFMPSIFLIITLIGMAAGWYAGAANRTITG